ncbi:putative apyrase 6 [Sesbania bispinosa]|nr:putative apyrase 6 [Sesbania bispinosa]
MFSLSRIPLPFPLFSLFTEAIWVSILSSVYTNPSAIINLSHMRHYSLCSSSLGIKGRVHVFKYEVDKVFNFGNKGLVLMRVNPGMSSFARGSRWCRSIPFGASGVLEGSDPKGELEGWIRIIATIGLRMLDAALLERILKSCRRVLRSSSFKFGNIT